MSDLIGTLVQRNVCTHLQTKYGGGDSVYVSWVAAPVQSGYYWLVKHLYILLSGNGGFHDPTIKYIDVTISKRNPTLQQDLTNIPLDYAIMTPSAIDPVNQLNAVAHYEAEAQLYFEPYSYPFVVVTNLSSGYVDVYITYDSFSVDYIAETTTNSYTP
jgi:hypothetical protein